MRTPVISLWRPWANWVALGWKPIESRTHQRFKSLVGRKIGIHATAGWDPEWSILAGQYLTEDQICSTGDFLQIGGAIICTAFVSEHRPLVAADSMKALIDCQNVERHGLILTNLESIEAIPCKGKQGIWYADIP